MPTDESLEDFYEGAPCGLLSTDPDGLILRVNQTLLTWTGHAREALVGQRRFRDCLSVPGKIFHDTHYGPLLQMQGSVEEIAFDLVRADGGALPALVSAVVQRGDDGAAGLIRVAVFRAADRRRYERALLLAKQRKSEQLAALVDASSDAILGLGIGGVIETWNEAASRLYGYTEGEALGQPAWMLAPEDGQDEERRYVARVAAGERRELEAVHRRRDGSLVQVAVSGAPIRGPHDEASGLVTIHRDVTARKKAEEHTQQMMRELTHRTKNLLALVLAIARQSAATSESKDELLLRFAGRIRALAAAHDLLAADAWRGAALAEVLHGQLAPFAELSRHRISAEGPALVLAPDIAQSLALAAHELATNAVKHGALSVDEGRVSVRWQIHGEGPAARFEMIWAEEGGPEVTPPTHQGFGRVVVERLTAASLGGTATLHFEPAGVRWVLEAPAAGLGTPPAA